MVDYYNVSGIGKANIGPHMCPKLVSTQKRGVFKHPKPGYGNTLHKGSYLN